MCDACIEGVQSSGGGNHCLHAVLVCQVIERFTAELRWQLGKATPASDSDQTEVRCRNLAPWETLEETLDWDLWRFAGTQQWRTQRAICQRALATSRAPHKPSSSAPSMSNLMNVGVAPP